MNYVDYHNNYSQSGSNKDRILYTVAGFEQYAIGIKWWQTEKPFQISFLLTDTTEAIDKNSKMVKITNVDDVPVELLGASYRIYQRLNKYVEGILQEYSSLVISDKTVNTLMYEES